MKHVLLATGAGSVGVVRAGEEEGGRDGAVEVECAKEDLVLELTAVALGQEVVHPVLWSDGFGRRRRPEHAGERWRGGVGREPGAEEVGRMAGPADERLGRGGAPEQLEPGPAKCQSGQSDPVQDRGYQRARS